MNEYRRVRTRGIHPAPTINMLPANAHCAPCYHLRIRLNGDRVGIRNARIVQRFVVAPMNVTNAREWKRR